MLSGALAAATGGAALVVWCDIDGTRCARCTRNFLKCRPDIG
jgi:hypothetical protein